MDISSIAIEALLGTLMSRNQDTQADCLLCIVYIKERAAAEGHFGLR